MTSTPSVQTRPRRRKPAGERRREIVATAAEIGVAEGLDTLTLRRVADALGVFPGLVHHYFPTVDDLVAEAFEQAASSEIEEVFAAVDAAATPVEAARELLAALAGPERDTTSVMWLDAWQGGRRRPALHAAVTRQMDAWRQRIGAMVEIGVAAGTFTSADPQASAVRILAVVDGLSVQAVTRPSSPLHQDYEIVRDLARTVTERELGLAAGTLS